MHVFETVREMRDYRRGLSGRVALVATLGGMHAGHEAHLVRAREVADVTVGSLFLNPTQFAGNEDLATYPQDRAHDLGIFEKYGTVAVFAPTQGEMYPPGDSTEVNPGKIATVLEGEHRPGHFVGVATVVAKLFAIVSPDVATFGEKDAQQLRIVEKLNNDLKFGIEIARIPTVREPDGLALSSRNRYLTREQRNAAPLLYDSLKSGRNLWIAGERNAGSIKRHVMELLGREPLLRVEYVSMADPVMLGELDGAVRNGALLSLAVQIGRARLIDNVTLR